MTRVNSMSSETNTLQPLFDLERMTIYLSFNQLSFEINCLFVFYNGGYENIHFNTGIKKFNNIL